MPRMTQEELDNYNAKRNKNNSTRPVRNMERHTGDAVEKAHGIQAFVQKVNIHFTHYRRRLADCDNMCSKSFVDGLVAAGILLDDNPQRVEEVRHRQVKIESWKDEYFEIRIVETEQGD